MKYLGLSSGFHDASSTVINGDGSILFAGHSERYSKNKHDKELCDGLLIDAASAIGADDYQTHYYEKPWLKYLRQLRSGERPNWRSAFVGHAVKQNTVYMPNIQTHGHHLSHAAAGFQTSPYKEATVVIIDAIGEFDTITIWDARYDDNGKAKYKKLWSRRYPDSIGLFYSAMTKRVGLRPLDEEYILMGMAAYGKPNYYSTLHSDMLQDCLELSFNSNLQIGVPDDYLGSADYMDIAASTQILVEQLIENVFVRAKLIGRSDNLVYGGGVALNCLANANIIKYFNNIWIMPNPGDAGSSLGAAALGYGRRVKWENAYLGHEIPGKYPVDSILNELLTNKIAGVASGKAEFGPRALGNRSLLADPRGSEIKEKVNEIKRRQQFRPFAPVIMEEFANDYFIMPHANIDHRYMQYIVTCRSPELFPAIVHVDNTSRVQTVPKDGSGIRNLLEQWYLKTNCPMLLNTSLNIRGEPIVDNRNDADKFEKLYGVCVFS